MKAHATALVDPGATVADDVEIGPFCIVGAGARIGPGCRLGARVSLQGPATLGRDNILHANVSIGSPAGGAVEIGDGNILRESTHVASTAKVGSRNRFGAWVNIGGAAEVGDDTVLGAFAIVAENCVVGSKVKIEGQTVLEPGMTVGAGARIRSQVPVIGDVDAEVLLDGNPAEARK